jgi:hypothetical protein
MVTTSLALKEGHRQRVFKRISVPKRNYVTGDWGKLHEVKACRRSRGIAPLILNLSTTCR